MARAPKKYAEAPGMARRAAEMSPPAEDSDTPTVWRRRVSREPAAAASGARSFTLQECHEHDGSAEVRLPPRRSPTPERAAPPGGPRRIQHGSDDHAQGRGWSFVRRLSRRSRRQAKGGH